MGYLGRLMHNVVFHKEKVKGNVSAGVPRYVEQAILDATQRADTFHSNLQM